MSRIASPTGGMLALWVRLFRDQMIARTRRRSRSRLVRPNIWRLSIFSRLTCPSTWPRTPARREAGDDGVSIAAEARHEGVQRRHVVSRHRVHPPLEPVAAHLPDHLGERSDVPGEGVQLRAAIQERLKAALLVGLQLVRLAHDPADEFPDLEL